MIEKDPLLGIDNLKLPTDEIARQMGALALGPTDNSDQSGHYVLSELQHELFQPLVPKDDESGTLTDVYNEDFDPFDDSNIPSVLSIGDNRSSRLRREPTQKAIEDSLAVLENKELDPNIQDMLHAHAVIGDIDAPEVVSDIRETKGLRIELAKFLRSKADSLQSELGDRVRMNTKKKIDIAGYRKDEVESLDYVTLLALSMLDGTFDDSKVRSSDDNVASNGRITLGQHRDAARRLLFSTASEK